MAKKFRKLTLNGINWNKYHSFSYIHKPTCRRPSSGFFANRFRSAACQKIQLPPGGSQELRRLWCTPFNKPLCCVGFGSPSRRPLQWLCKIMGLYNLHSTPPQSARSGCQLPQRWSQGRFAPCIFVNFPIKCQCSQHSGRCAQSIPSGAPPARPSAP